MRASILAVWAAIALWPCDNWGLTLYRIGGPPPAQTEGVDIVHLAWEEAFAGFEGRTEGLLFAGGQATPILVTADDNLALTAKDRGGGPKSARFGVGGFLETENEVSAGIADGDSTTVFKNTDSEHVGARVVLILDLGGRFPVNRVRFYPSPQFPLRFIEQFILTAYDDDRDEVIVSETDNRSSIVDLLFPPQAADRLVLSMAFRQRDWEVAEFEAYSEGYVLEGFYQTQIFDLGGPATVGDLRWSGFRERDARVKIRTRNGTAADPNRYWRFTGRGGEQTFRDAAGQPLTRAAYDKLKGNKADITTDLDHWNPWSGTYDFADSTGAPIIAPSARQYLQLQVLLLPKGFQGAGLHFVEFTASQPPIADQVVGEIWPVEAESGQVTLFTYAFKPVLSPGNSGFDQLVLQTSGRFVGIDSVHVNGDGVDWAADLAHERLVLSLPRMDTTDSQKLVEVFFRAEVFHFGTAFEGWVFDSERPLEVGQQVQGGDATFALDSNQVWTGILLRGRLVSEVRAQPPVVTPNGDGVNDAAGIEYSLLELVGTGQVAVDIFDLAGRLVRPLYRGHLRSGRHVHLWDGRRADGSAVAPGTYLYQVRVDTDEAREEHTGAVSVAY